MANQRREEVAAPELPGGFGLQRAFAQAGNVSASSLGAAADGSNGVPEAYGHAARVLGGMADEIGKVADQARQTEGTRQGALAGFDPEFRPKNENTLFAKAYDEAAVHTYKGQMSVNLTGQMEKAYDANKDDPAALNEAMSQIKQGWQENIDPSLAPHVLPHFEATFNRHAISLNREASRNQLSRAREEQLATVQDETAMHLRSVEQQAYRLGLDATADDVLAGEVGAMRDRLGQKGADGRQILLPSMQARLVRDAEQNIAKARISGAFDRLGGLDEKQAFIDKIENDYRAGGNKLLDGFDPQHYETLVSHLYSQAKRQELGSAQAKREITKGLSAQRSAAEQGIPLSDGDRTKLQASVAMSGTPDQFDEFNRSTATLALVKQLNVTPPDQLETFARKERQRLARVGVDRSEWEFNRLKLVDTYIANQKEQLNSNLLGVAAKHGVAKVDPLDLGSGEGLGKTLAARIPDAEHAAEFFKRVVQYFTPEEKAELGAIGRQGGQQLIALSAAIVQGAGDRAPKVLAEFTKDAPEVAVIGQLAANGGSEAVIKDAANGIHLRHMGKDFKANAPGEAELRGPANDVIGDSFRGNEEAQSTAVGLANAVYEVRSRQKQLQDFDEGVWKQGLREVLGERAIGGEKVGGVAYQQPGWLWGGSQPVLIPPNMKQAKFGQVLDALTMDDLVASNGAKPIDSKQRDMTLAGIRAGRLTAVGDGQYMIQTGQDEQGRREVVYRDARPMVLDLKALEPKLRARRPDLYAGDK